MGNRENATQADLRSKLSKALGSVGFTPSCHLHEVDGIYANFSTGRATK